MRAVIYARYSSHNQKDASIDQQLRVCRRYAEENGLTVVGEYADHALTGTTDRRPEFLRMIKDAEKERFQIVLVYKVDRFARNRYDSATYKAKLKRHGVRLISAMEPIPETPEGILLESLLEGSAEYYSANLSQNILRGMRDNAQKCMVNNGGLPLGYKKGPDGRYAIEPAEAEIVREIYRRYSAGESTQKITDDLNARGIRTSRGGAWNKNSLHRMLQNERYTGVYIWGDVRIEGGIPAIITREVFESVQHKREMIADKPARAKAKVDYLLVGKLFCGHCLSPMIGDSGTSKSGATFNYYNCNKRKHGHACDKTPVKKTWIEDLVVSATRQHCLTDEVIDRVADQVMKRQEEEANSCRLASLEAELSEVKKGINHAVDAIIAGYASETLKEKLEALEKRKNELEDAIVLENIDKPAFTREMIVDWIRRFREMDSEDQELRKTLVRVFVKAVYLYDDHLDLVYGYDPEETAPGPTFDLEAEDAEVFGFDLHASTIAGVSEHVELRVLKNVFVISLKIV